MAGKLGTMESITPAQFFEEGRSLTVSVKFDNIDIGVSTRAVRTTPEAGANDSAPLDVTPGFSIISKGEYPHGSELHVDIPELPYDEMWPMVNEIVKESVSHMIFTDYPAACKKAEANLEKVQNKEGDMVQFFDQEPGLEELQEVVGGYFTLQRTLDGRIMAMDEEGILKKLPVNEEASKLAGQEVRGRVAVYRAGADEEGEEEASISECISSDQGDRFGNCTGQ